MPASEPEVSITIHLPKAVADLLGDDQKAVARRILEQTVADTYRSGQLSRAEVSRILNLSWPQTEEFLATYRCDRHYGFDELNEDRKTARELFGPK